MGMDRFLDWLEEKRRREAPLMFATEPFTEVIEDERWPESKRSKVVMPGVRLSRKRNKYGAITITITQRGVIATKPMTTEERAALVYDQIYAPDPLDLLIAKQEEQGNEPPPKKIGRLRAKQAAMDAARPRKRLLQPWVPTT